MSEERKTKTDVTAPASAALERIDHQHLEATEDLSVHLLTLEEVKRLLDNNEIMQALNAAPLWKYIASL